MESIGGEEMERALMDLGPLLGVSIKEEVQEDIHDPSAGNAANTAGGSSESEAGGASAGGGGAGGSGGGARGVEAGGADSLASPGVPPPPPLSAARCVLCSTLLAQADGTPKLMECLHSACEPCVKAKIEEKLASGRDFLGAERMTITCPVCRLQCQPANMIDQRFVLEKVALEQTGNNGAVAGEQQCNSCEEAPPATSYCGDCAEFICDSCVSAHQRLKITKDHTIKSKDEALADLHAAQMANRTSHDMFCREHPQERLSLFCETCDRLTCRDCQLQHHRDHKYQFSTEMAAQARGSISALLSEVSYKRVLLGSAMKVIKDRQQLIADKKKALVHEITQTVVKLTNAINSRGKQLVLRLSEVCDSKLRTLSEKRDALQQLAAITDHCLDFVNAALEQGSDTALLYSKRCVCAHLQRIKSRRADIPNPEIPVRIGLALDKLPELIRVLSTIGAIVVDGKVDGSSGGAQGPYHPPQQQQQQQQQQQHGQQQQLVPVGHAALSVAPHNALVAMQHAHMHQSYVASVSGGGGGAGGAYGAGCGAARARGPGGGVSPLRQPHVSSTTHPHHLHGMSELNLRGLLSPAPRPQPARALHPMHSMHHYQQMMGAYASQYNNNSGRRSGGPRTPSPSPAPPAGPPSGPPAGPHPAPPAYTLHPHQQSHVQHAKWHIPQHNAPNGGTEMSCMSGGGADFKITLGRQHPPAAPAAPPAAPRQPALVTSTNPKTPSPSLHGGVSMELDKVCAESVQDLMATIAKLDSNGVQVVAERTSPHPVHSSTSPAARPQPEKPLPSGGGASDPNEDWCAVCMDGGELMCCDKCPKVFHQYCHIPTIDKLPDESETWQCLLCVNFAELPPEQAWGGPGLSPRQQKLVERVTLELYCQYEPSLAFREPVPPSDTHYYDKISEPMCLDMIRMKLQPESSARYSSVHQFVADCRLMFRNAYHYNPPESQIYKDAKRLEEFYDVQLLKWLPEYAYWSGQGEPPSKRARLH